MINGAGHHVYLDKPDLFNKFVQEACSKADEYDPQLEITQKKAEGDTKVIQSQNDTANVAQSPPVALTNQREEIS